MWHTLAHSPGMWQEAFTIEAVKVVSDLYLGILRAEDNGDARVIDPGFRSAITPLTVCTP